MKFESNLVGQYLKEDPEKAWIDKARFAYYGLVGPVRILAAWTREGSATVLVSDKDGRTAEIYPAGLFRIVSTDSRNSKAYYQ